MKVYLASTALEFSPLNFLGILFFRFVSLWLWKSSLSRYYWHFSNWFSVFCFYQGSSAALVFTFFVMICLQTRSQLLRHRYQHAHLSNELCLFLTFFKKTWRNFLKITWKITITINSRKLVKWRFLWNKINWDLKSKIKNKMDPKDFIRGFFGIPRWVKNLSRFPWFPF